MPEPHGFERHAVSSPENVAAWLINNTDLTISQIASFCAIDPHAIRTTVNVALRYSRDHNAVASGLISLAEIERCSNDESALPERHLGHLSECPRLRLCIGPANIADEIAIDCYSTKVSYLLYGRNAWHSTWIRRYYAENSLALRAGPLQKWTEINRVQGSVFSIEELPAIAVQFDRSTLLIVELNEEGELSRLSNLRELPCTTRKLSKHFSTSKENTIVVLAIDGNIRLPKMKEGHSLRMWQARPRGTGRSIDWRMHRKSVFKSEIHSKIVEQVEQLRQPTLFKRELVRLLAPQEIATLSDIAFECIVLSNGWLRLLVDADEQNSLDAHHYYLSKMLNPILNNQPESEPI